MGVYMNDIVKICKVHGCITKDQSYSYLNKKKSGKIAIICKQCKIISRKKVDPRKKLSYKLKNEFGISIEEYERLLNLQKNVCDICRKKETSCHFKNKKIKNLAIDHDHNLPGKIRGLLCFRCNTLLGLSKDSIKILKSAIKYLNKNK